MSIEAGAQFLVAKVPICKGFPILFNDNRLYGDFEMITVEPFEIIGFDLYAYTNDDRQQNEIRVEMGMKLL